MDNRDNSGRGGNIVTRYFADWNRRTVLLTGALMGGVGGGITLLNHGAAAADSVLSSLFFAIIFPPYFIVPRVKRHRVMQGFGGSVVGGVVSGAIMILFATSAVESVGRTAALLFAAYLLGGLGVSWLSAVMARWGDKRRAQAEAKRVAAGLPAVAPRPERAPKKSSWLERRRAANKEPEKKKSSLPPSRGRLASRRPARFKAQQATKKQSIRELIKKPEPVKPERVHKHRAKKR